MENEKSVYEDDETNCYQISDEEEEEYGKNEESQNNSDNSNLTRGPYERAWTTEATRALIHIRGPMEDEFSEGRAKRTMLWIQVTKQLQKMGFRYSAAKVQKKWHNILITYNKNISRKEDTGSVSWEFFEDMYIYLKGKKAKTFEFVTDSFQPPNPSANHKANSDHQRQLQYQMQQQHRILQKQKMRQQQEQSKQQSRNHMRPDKTEKNRNSIPSTSHDFNDTSNNNEDFPIVDEEEITQKRQNDESFDEPKSKIKKKMLKVDEDGLYEPTVDKLPLEISHVEGADDFRFDEALEEDPFLEDDWWKDYFYKKLDTDRERIDLHKQIHRDQMNYNKMVLMQQEKIERIKIEAINNLTATLQKLVEGKGHKKI